MSTDIDTRRTRFRIPLPVLLPMLVLALMLADTDAHAEWSMHHDIAATIDPDRHRLVADDTITLPSAAASDTTLTFRLHRTLEPRLLSAGAELSALTMPDNADEPARYRLRLSAGTSSVRLHYEGTIRHDSAAARAAPESIRGAITPEGIFLGGTSHWHPDFDEATTTFDLLLHLPAGWDAVSQGERVLHERNDDGTRVRWREDHPQTAIELAAGRYHEYGRELLIGDRRIAAMAFLHAPDAALAARYLDATDTWLRRYEHLFGEYPYGKFALVENFLETGYGMPSFTLLGGAVIRLPFIVHTSYPHEILHNWWGNGVYVDAGRGNWSEGLTAYFADHLVAEQRGEGAAMRRRQLQRYADYVHEGADLPLAAFRSRHDEASQAVGYGKAMMFFHMLRRELGEDVLLAGLRDFYRQRRFLVSDWRDLRLAIEAHAGRDLRTLFSQWIDRAGAPRLRPLSAHAHARNDGSYTLVAAIAQTAEGAAYRMELPLRIELEDGRTIDTSLAIDDARTTLRMTVPARPLRLSVDPGFDVFRHLERGELPPALGEAFGARRITIVLPAAAPAALGAMYRELAQAWRGARDASDFLVVEDRAITRLPEEGAIWVLGWNNALLPALRSALAGTGVEWQNDTLQLSATGAIPPAAPSTLRRGEHTVALAARRENGQPLAWLAADDPENLRRLARKLPRYGSYGYAVFEAGSTADPIFQGEWPLTDSPMTIRIASEPTPDPAVEPEEETAESPD